MFALQVIQADFGDCFILKYGQSALPKYILIDGGPKGTYKNHLKDETKKIENSGGEIELAVVSHVDDDHICGMLDLLLDIREEYIKSNKKSLKIKSLWHNTFDLTVDKDKDMSQELKSYALSPNFDEQTHTVAELACYSIKQGLQLNQIFEAHNIPINPESQGKIVTVESMPRNITKDSLTLRVVGPTEQNLAELKKEWLHWLAQQKKGEPNDNPFFEAMSDKSYTNVSSIMILAESNGKKILLPGDGRGDHLLEGLKKAGLLDPKGELLVDILKLPHHGSINNVSKEFFQKVMAKTYIISANGKHGHPSFETLEYLVGSAFDRGRTITLFATNRTPSLDKLVEEYPPSHYQYTISFMEKEANSALLTP